MFKVNIPKAAARVPGFLTVYSRLKNKRNIVTKTKINDRRKTN
jgi:hypothetical protein